MCLLLCSASHCDGVCSASSKLSPQLATTNKRRLNRVVTWARLFYSLGKNLSPGSVVKKTSDYLATLACTFPYQMATVKNPTESKPPNTARLLCLQKDSIAKVYRSFRTKYDTCTDRTPLFPSDTIQLTDPDPIDVAAWRSKLSRLRSILLPLLRHQIRTVLRTLDPSDLRNDKGPKLDLISELQSEVDDTMGQIVSCVIVIPPRPLIQLPDTNDHYLKDLKEFQCREMVRRLSYMNRGLSCMFDGCATLIEESKLSRRRYRRRARQHNTRGDVIDSSENASEWIDILIKWSKCNELTNIQEDWEVEVPVIDEVLAKLTRLIRPTATSNSAEEDQPEIEGASEAVIQLAQNAVPITKLARLFFRKVATSGLNRTPLQTFTEMNSNQLRTLSESPEYLDDEFNRLFKTLNKADETDVADTIEALTQAVNRTIEIFQTSMFLVTLYIVPLIPQANGPSSQDNLQNWLITWNNLFLSATQKFLSAAQRFGTPL
ncbi:hypothetical protein PtB15_14B370 [Puccinia triticina]|nr:hypothetical protein PtB15_14B370 [Puccinia triticina]